MSKPPTAIATAKASAAREAAAERMRRCRARRRAGYRCVMIEVSDAEIAGLVRRGLLSADNRDDLQSIESAVYDLFGQTIARPL